MLQIIRINNGRNITEKKITMERVNKNYFEL